MKKILFNAALLLVLLSGCVGCTTPEEEVQNGSSGITLMTWNVHNLFDGRDDGFEYDEFRQSSGWTEEKYKDRIISISAAISGLDRKPDIIMLQEVESLTVLEDLAASFPPSTGYSWSHFAGNYGAAAGLGIISRLPFGESAEGVRTHSVTVGNETAPRPVLEVRIDNEEEPFVIFICHWKSKLGGDDNTEILRRASARVILRRMRELWENEPEIGIIIAGDLNTNHDDFYRRGSETITALLPDDPYTSRNAGEQKDFFVLSKNKPPCPVYFSDDTIVLFSPWVEELELGSYYYSYNWETIDHFLLTHQFFDGSGWEYKSAEVINYPPFANANGIPLGYNTRTGNGLSDHLPLIFYLQRSVLNQDY